MVSVECEVISSPASFRRFLKTASDLLLEAGVADGGDLVDQVPVEGDAHRHAEGEPRLHARGIGAHRHVDEVAELGEVLDVGHQRRRYRCRRSAPRSGCSAHRSARGAKLPPKPSGQEIEAWRRISPESGRTVPATMPSSVDLPAPLRPSTPTLAPVGSVRVRSSSTTLRPAVGRVGLGDVAELDHRRWIGGLSGCPGHCSR